MKIFRKYLNVLLIIFLGILLSYCLLTRINLFFLVPLWVKLLLLGGSAANLTMLLLILQKRYLTQCRTNSWMRQLPLIALIGTALIFMFIPYQHVPFRTTHHLTVKAIDSTVELHGIYSPDHNIINRTEINLKGEVEPYLETGYVLQPGSKIEYQRDFTGGLTLSFLSGEGTVAIEWDGQQKTISLSENEVRRGRAADDWKVSYETDTNLVYISLPGNTWGKPSLFWTMLGALLPISDFISLCLIILMLLWVVGNHITRQEHLQVSKGFISAWLGMILVIISIRLGIAAYIPNTNSWLGLVLFIPPAIYLGIIQCEFLSKKNIINPSYLEKCRTIIAWLRKKAESLNQTKALFWIAGVLLALMGAVSLLHITQPGMGISGDSVHYLEGATNLASGLGYVRRIEVGEPDPITGFPPGFPLLLVPIIKLGVDPQSAARFLNLGLYIAYILTMGWITFYFTKRVLPAILIAAFSVMFIPMESIFAWVMSEPLFITLMLPLFVLCYIYIKHPKTWILILLGILSGFLLLIRLAGLSVIAAIALVILIHQHRKALKKWGNVFIYGLLSILPTVIFLYRNSQVSDTLSESRGLNFATFKGEYWKTILTELASWLKLQHLFEEEAGLFSIFLVFTVFILGAYCFIRFKNNIANTNAIPFLDILVIFIILYILMIILNVVIFTPDQTVSGLSRYTIPLYPAGLILTAFLFSKVFWRKSGYLPKILIFVFLVVLLRLYNYDYVAFNQKQPMRFRAYTDVKVECEDNLDIFETITDGNEIYSNNCDFIFFASGQSCHHLPLEPEAYQENSPLVNEIKSGGIVAIMNDYGSDPPIKDLLEQMAFIDFECMISFYQWHSTTE